MPSFIKLIGSQPISWTRANRLLYNSVERSRKRIKSEGQGFIQDATFYSVLVGKFRGDGKSVALFDYFNRLFSNLNSILSDEEKKQIQSTVSKILTELSRNYLNYIGELSVLYWFKSSEQFELCKVEGIVSAKESNQSVDFLLRKINSDEFVTVEVLNLHLELTGFENIGHLRYWLNSKYCKKKEEKSISLNSNIMLQPVVWVNSVKQLETLKTLYADMNFINESVNIPMVYMFSRNDSGEFEHYFGPVDTIL